MKLTLPYPPSVNQIYRRRQRGGIYKVSTAKTFEYEVLAIVGANGRQRQPPMVGLVSISIDIYPPDKRRRDVDNVLKVLLDSLTGAQVWRDDSQVVELTIRRQPPDKSNPRCEVEINGTERLSVDATI